MKNFLSLTEIKSIITPIESLYQDHHRSETVELLAQNNIQNSTKHKMYAELEPQQEQIDNCLKWKNLVPECLQ